MYRFPSRSRYLIPRRTLASFRIRETSTPTSTSTSTSTSSSSASASSSASTSNLPPHLSSSTPITSTPTKFQATEPSTSTESTSPSTSTSSTESSTSPSPSPSPSPSSSTDSSSSFTVYSYGSGTYGTLGHGSYTDITTPTPIPHLYDIIQIAAGWGHVVAVDRYGNVYEWGWSCLPQTSATPSAGDDDPSILSVLATSFTPALRPAIHTGPHSLRSLMMVAQAKRIAPKLLSFLQQLPIGRLGFRGATTSPSRILQFGWSAEGKELPLASAASAGSDFSCVITDDGSLYTWGANFYGQTGHPSTDVTGATIIAPRRITSGDIAGKNIIAVACGFAHMLCLDSNGMVYSCGNNKYGQLGLAFTSGMRFQSSDDDDDLIESDRDEEVDNNKKKINQFERVFGLHGVQQHNDMVAAHQSASTIALTPLSSTSLLRTSGLSPHSITPVTQTMGPVTAIAAGFHHSVFLSNGHVYTCGRGSMGALGHGDFKDVYYPQRVMALPHDDPIIQIACGQHHTVALSASGRVYTWGMNRHHQLARPPSHAIINYHTRNVNRRSMIDAMTCPIPACINEYVNEALGREMGQVIQIKAGFYDTVLLTSTGECIMFGGGLSQQGHTQPHIAYPHLHIHDISFGLTHAFIVGKEKHVEKEMEQTSQSQTPQAEQTSQS